MFRQWNARSANPKSRSCSPLRDRNKRKAKGQDDKIVAVQCLHCRIVLEISKYKGFERTKTYHNGKRCRNFPARIADDAPWTCPKNTCEHVMFENFQGATTHFAAKHGRKVDVHPPLYRELTAADLQRHRDRDSTTAAYSKFCEVIYMCPHCLHTPVTKTARSQESLEVHWATCRRTIPVLTDRTSAAKRWECARASCSGVAYTSIHQAKQHVDGCAAQAPSAPLPNTFRALQAAKILEIMRAVKGSQGVHGPALQEELTWRTHRCLAKIKTAKAMTDVLCAKPLALGHISCEAHPKRGRSGTPSGNGSGTHHNVNLRTPVPPRQARHRPPPVGTSLARAPVICHVASCSSEVVMLDRHGLPCCYWHFASE